MFAALWSRLRLEAPNLRTRDPARDRAVKRRGMLYLLVAGSVLISVPAWAGTAHAERGPLIAIVALGVALAAVTSLVSRTAVGPVLVLVQVAAAALITAAVRFGGDAAPTLALLYLWLALYAAYFDSRAWLTVQLAVILIGAAAALLGAGADPAVWIITAAAVLLTAALWRLLRDRVYVLLALLAEAARTDPLTGLLNRRAIEERLEAELARSTRAAKPLSIVMVDLDGFKRVNDEFGHHAGDEALEAFAEILRTCARRSDAIARMGGDEFALVLPETDAADAERLAERIAGRLNATPIGGSIRVTATTGRASFPQDGATFDELFRVADGALYAGRGASSRRQPGVSSIDTRRAAGA